MQFELLSSPISIFSSEMNHAQVKKEKKKIYNRQVLLKPPEPWALLNSF